MSLNQPSRWHHNCQQKNSTVPVTPVHLELVPEGTSDIEPCTAEIWHRTQEELLWYRKLYENTPSIYITLNQAGIILSINHFGAKSLGYSPEDLLQKPIFNLFNHSEKQRLSEILMELFEQSSSNETNKWEFHLDCPNSQIKIVKIIARILNVKQDNKLIFIVCEDITAHKLSDEVLQETKAHLDEMTNLNHLKNEFLSTISHELRTPLTNMKMAIQMLGIALDKEHNLLSEMAKPYAEQSKMARYFQILNNECEREINLINNFLDLQRLDTSAKPLVLEKIQIQESLEKILEIFKARNQISWLHNLRLCVTPHLPPLACDTFTLERILWELLTNACKFSPPGSQIVVSAQSQSDYIQIQVSNSGVEIPLSERSLIFDKFYRIPSNDPWRQGGTGLGLALVQKLTQSLGGTIEVESGSNQTCLTIQLPLSGEN